MTNKRGKIQLANKNQTEARVFYRLTRENYDVNDLYTGVDNRRLNTAQANGHNLQLEMSRAVSEATKALTNIIPRPNHVKYRCSMTNAVTSGTAMATPKSERLRINWKSKAHIACVRYLLGPFCKQVGGHENWGV